MLLLQMQSAVEKDKWLVELVQDAIMWLGKEGRMAFIMLLPLLIYQNWLV